MTALSVLVAPSGASDDATLPPVPWRRMAWVTWRQHRVALYGVAVLLSLVTLYVALTGVRLHDAYSSAIACRPAGSFACAGFISSFNGTAQFLSNGILLQALPALIGAFVGAPLLAREFETGTFRYAWTQAFGRARWTLAKLVALAVTVSAAAGAVSVLFSWYYQPYFATSNQPRALVELLPLSPGLFNLRGITFAAWTLLAFSIGVMAGALIRRVVPAIVVTLAAYTGLLVVTGGYLRQHYLAPLVTRSLNLPNSTFVLSQQWVSRAGHPVSKAVLNQVLQQGGRELAGKGGVPNDPNSWQYLVQHGYIQWTTYQPASRFWPFQWIEGGWLLALSVLLVAATVWLVGRRAL